MEQDMKKWAEGVFEKIKAKMEVVAGRNAHKIPYTTVDGRYDDWSIDKIGWWTNGFWGGIMWQMYQATGEELYKEIAKESEKKLDGALFDHRPMDHDSGFRWLPTSLASYLVTGDESSYNRLRLAADNLAGRFNPNGNYIRAWNDGGDGSKAGWAIIDCMMNLPLLYWAYGDTRDPRYLAVATRHADTAMKYFIREDGSANHIVEFDPATGEFVKSYGGQGFGEGSSWTRGQGWALYGFTLSYIHTGRREYLDTACRVADYFISQIPESGLIPVDFKQPSDCALEDSTASAIASCGLITLGGELRKVEGFESGRAEKYFAAAGRLLRALVENRCDFTLEKDNIVEKCTAAFNDKEHEFAIIYGDYYFIEAICKLTGTELFIW